jgi:hypothetical protein
MLLVAWSHFLFPGHSLFTYGHQSQRFNMSCTIVVGSRVSVVHFLGISGKLYHDHVREEVHGTQDIVPFVPKISMVGQ